MATMVVLVPWFLLGVINVWLFLLVGIQLSGDMLVREAWPILLAVVALHAGRAVAVYVCFGALHLSGQGVPWPWQHVMVFGNVKGALSMAAVLALPQNIPYRERLIAIVFGVTLVTLLTQALPFESLSPAAALILMSPVVSVYHHPAPAVPWVAVSVLLPLFGPPFWVGTVRR